MTCRLALRFISHVNVPAYDLLLQVCEFLDVYETDGPSALGIYKTDDLEWEEVKYITQHEKDQEHIGDQLIEDGNNITYTFDLIGWFVSCNMLFESLVHPWANSIEKSDLLLIWLRSRLHAHNSLSLGNRSIVQSESR